MDTFTLKNNKILFVGKTKSGKSELFRYMLTENKHHFKKIFLICPTESINSFYTHDKLIDKNNVFDNFSETWLQKLMKKMIEINGNKDAKEKRDILIIFDDCCSDTNFHQSKAIKTLFTRGRHLNIAVAIMAQYPYHIPPVCRTNCDYIICGQMNQQSVLKVMDEFLAGSISRKEFLELYERSTSDYQFLVINNMSVKNNDNLDSIYGIIKTPEKYLKK